MKKVVIVVAVLVGVGVLVKRSMPDLGKIDWEQKFESMPDNAPPKWMFRNITTIRENTERIIELLGGDSGERGGNGSGAPPAGGGRDAGGGDAT